MVRLVLTERPKLIHGEIKLFLEKKKKSEFEPKCILNV